VSEQQHAFGRRRYVVGVDGSTASIEALRWAVAEAQAHGGGDVRAVLVWAAPYGPLMSGMASEPYPVPDATIIEQEAKQRLTNVIEAVGNTSPVEVQGELLEGQPSAVLLELSHRSDLVVVGSRGHGGFGALLLGSVSAQVVRHAHCTVVVVRPADPDPERSS
jgi:nucleotide-binding universal stress UspA family protein